MKPINVDAWKTLSVSNNYKDCSVTLNCAFNGETAFKKLPSTQERELHYSILFRAYFSFERDLICLTPVNHLSSRLTTAYACICKLLLFKWHTT